MNKKNNKRGKRQIATKQIWGKKEIKKKKNISVRTETSLLCFFYYFVGSA